MSRVPDGYFLQKLEKEHADIVVDHWPYFKEMPNKTNTIAMFISTFISVGAFSTENPAQPVSWSCMLHCGEIAFVYTVEGHRRKGLSKAVVETITREVLDANMTPYLLVKGDNYQAKKLFEYTGYVQDLVDDTF